MTMSGPKIVFMGTPEFAVASLQALVMAGFDVAAVVTAPDKPAGRGRKISIPPVKEYAIHSGLKVLQPANLKDERFLSELAETDADLFVVVAFRMLPAAVWKMPPLGTINLHASLLPQYRGSAPINHAIINGETKTGLTTFFIDEKIDTGSLLMRHETEILPDENAGSLHDRMMKEGAELLVRTIEGIINKTLKPVPQDHLVPSSGLKSAPKIFPEFCTIDWHKDPVSIHNFVRGLSPYPCARTSLTDGRNEVNLKIYESTPELKEHDLEPGKFISDGKTFLKAACNGGFVNICILQPEGRKRMSVAEFLRGFRIEGYAEYLTSQV